MANTLIELKCGHKLLVNLPDDIKIKAAIIQNYKNQLCPKCRRQKEQALQEAKKLRMDSIAKLCPPLVHQDKKIIKHAEKIRHDKLSGLDDMFDKLSRVHGFSSIQEEHTFNHYRNRTIARFCKQDDVLWWLNHQTSPIESMIDELKEKTFVIEGQVFHENDK
ncbi:hypothetical protein [Pectinatus sottacetonis]|uniref:hypothetical protein n=1 Tax=Pectinatus sottacetonis TaxID=1002795 RepID=UPI0018C5DE7E|nr:hypothetical protein [Pectinatus sottacetonis]